MVQRARATLPKTKAEALADNIENNADRDGAISVRDMLLAEPSFRRFMVATAIRALSAQKYVFDKNTKEVIFFDDSATQLKAVVFLAAYTEGLPAQTNVNLNIGDRNKADKDALTLEQALRESPALRERLAATIEAARASSGGGRTLKQADKTTGAE